MAKEQAPAFQFYPRDFVGSFNVAGMTLEEVGFYTLLLCHAWLEEGLPNDHRRMARALHIPSVKFEKLWTVVGQQFKAWEDGTLRNSRQERERDNQRRYRDERSVAGKKGNAERWGETRRAITEPSLSDENGIANHRSSSSTASATATASAGRVSLPAIPIATGPHRNHAFCSIACVPAFLHVEFRNSLNRANEDDADDELRQGYLAHIAAWPEGRPTGNNLDFWRAWYRVKYPAAVPMMGAGKTAGNMAALETVLNRTRGADVA
jgi:uncharacterized protein YdaU (DUF1376 family)